MHVETENKGLDKNYGNVKKAALCSSTVEHNQCISERGRKERKREREKSTYPIEVIKIC